MVWPALAPIWKVAPWKVPSSRFTPLKSAVCDDVVDVGHELLELLVEVGAVGGAVGRIERLDREIAHRLQVIGDSVSAPEAVCASDTPSLAFCAA